MSISIKLVSGSVNVPPAQTWDGCGAIVTFEGRVRGVEQDEPISALIYEAYEPMTTTMLRSLAERVKERYRLLRIEVFHSVGTVAVGECSFFLRVGSEHRKEALQAMEFFIDEMKRTVPLWKIVAASGQS